MTATRRWVMILAPMVVVIVLGELHAHLVGHYPFTGTERFLWTLAYIALIEISAYLSGAFDIQRNQAGACGPASGPRWVAGWLSL